MEYCCTANILSLIVGDIHVIVLDGVDSIDFVDNIDTPKMVAFANGNMVEELSASSDPTILSPTPVVPRSGSFGSFARRYHRPTQHHPAMGLEPYADSAGNVMERPISPRSASGFMAGSGGIPCATISNASGGNAIPSINNEQYPCDCCRIEDQQYMRDFTPSGTMIRRSEVGIYFLTYV